MLTLRSPAQQVQCVLQVGVNVFGGGERESFNHIPLDGMEEGVLFMLLSWSPTDVVLVPCYATLELDGQALRPFQPVVLARGTEFVVTDHAMRCLLHSVESAVLDTGAETQPLELGGTGFVLVETGTQLLDQALPPPPPHTMVVEDEDDEDEDDVRSDDMLDNSNKKPRLDQASLQLPPKPATAFTKSRLIMGEPGGGEEEAAAGPSYGSWKVDQLRQELKQLGLETKGVKSDLVARLNLHHHQSPPSQDSFTFYRAGSMPAAASVVKPAVVAVVDQPTLILDQQDTGESLPSPPATPPSTSVAVTAPSTTATLPLDSANTPATLAGAAAASSPVAAVPFNQPPLNDDHSDSDNSYQPPTPSYHEMKVTELRRLCEERGLDPKGKKDVLVHRLLQSPSLTAGAEVLVAMKTPVRLLFTSFKPSSKQLKQVEQMGGVVLEEDSSSSPTHVVVLKAEIRRTLKLLSIMTQIGPHSARIVHSGWLVDSLAEGEWSCTPERYFPYEGNTSLEHALRLRDQASQGLLAGQHLLLSKDTKPSFQQLEPIVLQAGGRCELLTGVAQLDQPNVVVLGQGELSLDSEMRKRVQERGLTWMKPGWLLNCITSYSLGAGSDADLVISLGSFFQTST